MGDGSVQVRTTGLRHDWTKSVEPYLSTVTPGFPSATPCMTRYACLDAGRIRFVSQVCIRVRA